MSRLLVALFLSFCACFLIPTGIVYYFQLDRLEKVKWQERIAAIKELQKNVESIHKQSKDMGLIVTNGAKNLSPSDIQREELLLQRKALKTQLLLLRLEKALLDGVIKGSELGFGWALELIGRLSLVLAFACVIMMCWLTYRRGSAYIGTRYIIHSILRDAGVHPKDISTKELGSDLRALRFSRWHLAEARRWLYSNKSLSQANGIIGKLHTIIPALESLFNFYCISPLAPEIAGMQDLRAKQAEFDRSMHQVRQEVTREIETIEERGVSRAKKEFALHKENLIRQEEDLRKRQRSLQEDRAALEKSREEIRIEQVAIEREQFSLNATRQSIARDRDNAESYRAQTALLEHNIAQRCSRIEAAVTFLQGKLSEFDSEQNHLAHAEIIEALAKELTVATMQNVSQG